MLESFLLIFLGFLTAALLSLMLAPVLWRHAVQLTTRRIHGSTPLSLADIQADKDQLRAQFAVTTRKLEMAAEKWQDQAAGLQIALARAEQDAEAAQRESANKAGIVEELEGQLAMAKDELAHTQDELAGYLKSLKDTGNRLVEERARYEQQAKRLNDANILADERKVEIVALRTQAANLNDRVAGLKDDLARAKTQHEEASTELAQARAASRELAEQAQETERALLARDKSIETLKAELAAGEEKARARAHDAKAHADRTAADKADLERIIGQLRDRLENEVAVQRSSNEQLRDRLANVAAKVVATSMAADDKIAAAIGPILQTATQGAASRGEKNNGNGGSGKPAAGASARPGPIAPDTMVQPATLAERIRAEVSP